MADRIRVFVAEDHPIYREGLLRALRQRPELEVIGEADNGREALEAIREHKPDVAVLDEHMPELRGTDVLQAVQRESLPTRVLMLSASMDSGVVFRAVSNGIGGYLTKDADRERICDVVSAIARGETVIAQEVQAGLVDAVRLREHEDRPTLSPREQEILGLMADGQSAPDIAKALHLSTATVKTHMRNLYEKLGVSSGPAAVAEAMRRGLLE